MEVAQLYQLFTEYPIINTDSRRIEKDCLFFALKGENHDANYYAKDALSNGAAYAIVDKREIADSDKHILVDDTLDTLQKLAYYHRKRFNIPVLAITGSNGKTTTKELTARVLAKKYSCLSTQGNLNNHIGVPLTLLKMKQDHQIAIIEMGANHIGEIEKLCRIALPSYGLITNIGRAHLEGFGSFKGIIAAKTELYSYISEQLGKVFVNITDDLLMKHAGDISRVTFGLEPSADYSGELSSLHPFLDLICSENCTSFEVVSQLTGSYNANNIIAAVCIGRYFGVAVADLVDAIASYQPQNNRSQVLDTDMNHLILDAYNANPSSMETAIENFSNYPGKTKMCILGDMLELGSYSETEHKNILDRIRKHDFEKIILVGEHFSRHKYRYPDYKFFLDVQEAGAWLTNQAINGYTILLKGSRKIQLENLVDKL